MRSDAVHFKHAGIPPQHAHAIAQQVASGIVDEDKLIHAGMSRDLAQEVAGQLRSGIIKTAELTARGMSLRGALAIAEVIGR